MMDRSIQLKPSTQEQLLVLELMDHYNFFDATVSNNADKLIAYDTNGTSLTLGPTVSGLTTLTSKQQKYKLLLLYLVTLPQLLECNQI